MGATFEVEAFNRGNPEQRRPEIIVGRGLWKRRFGSDTGLLGKVIDVNIINLSRVGATPSFVVGIATADVHFPPLSADYNLGVGGIADSIDFWMPEVPDPTRRDNGDLDVIARLRPGVSLEQAQSEMDSISRNLAVAHPETNNGLSVRVVPLRDQVLGSARQVLFLLFASTGLVLLVACGNVANLLLARATTRQKEVAIRAALGAAQAADPAAVPDRIRADRAPGGRDRRRPRVWQRGSAAAVDSHERSARAGRRRRSHRSPVHVDRDVTDGLDHGHRPRISSVVGTSRRCLEARRTKRHSRTRTSTLVAILVASEVAMTLVLLIATGLMVKSANQLSHIDPGFDPRQLLTMTISLPNNKFEWRHNVVFSRQVIRSIEAMPEVRDAAVIQGVPMRIGSFFTGFSIEGRPDTPVDRLSGRLRVVSPGYFGVMNIPILSGRDYDEHDEVGEVGSLPSVIVNRALAERFWPGQDAVGKRVQMSWKTQPIDDHRCGRRCAIHRTRCGCRK